MLYGKYVIGLGFEWSNWCGRTGWQTWGGGAAAAPHFLYPIPGLLPHPVLTWAARWQQLTVGEGPLEEVPSLHHAVSSPCAVSCSDSGKRE